MTTLSLSVGLVLAGSATSPRLSPTPAFAEPGPQARGGCIFLGGFYRWSLSGSRSNCSSSANNGVINTNLIGDLNQSGCSFTAQLTETGVQGDLAITLTGNVVPGDALVGNITSAHTNNGPLTQGAGSFSGAESSGSISIGFSITESQGESCNFDGTLVGTPGSNTTTTTLPQGGSCGGRPDGSPCDDGIYCNGQDSCISQRCINHTGNPCAVGNGCVGNCNEAGRNCSNVSGRPCSDGNFCNGEEVCNDQAECLPGSPPDCDDGDPCTTDSCSQSQCHNVDQGGQCMLCGDANSSGTITTTDSLAALRAAVGQATCPLYLCDVDDGGSVTATDALAILKKAVDPSRTLTCPPRTS